MSEQPKSRSDEAQRPPTTLWVALFHPWTWRMAWRDSRSQRRRLAIFAFSIVSGMAALIAIHALKASVGKGIESQAKSLLGSDLQVTARAPLKPEVVQELRALSSALSSEISFASMLQFGSGDSTRLVQIRGFTGEFPYYGKVETEPPGLWEKMHTDGGILLEPGLMRQFSVRPGDRVRLGTAEFSVLGEFTRGLPRGSRFSGLAPEAYVREADLAATGLLGNRSFANYQWHLRLDPEIPAAGVKKTLETSQPTLGLRLETPEDRRESLDQALESLQQFLGIVAMIALVLGALGVASAVHAHLTRRVQSIAILRCLGCATGPAYAIYLVQIASLGLVATGIGIALGIGLQVGTLVLFQDRLPEGMEHSIPWAVIGRTALAGFALCCGFALFPLRRVRDIVPAQALRGGGLPPGQGIRRTWLPILILCGLVFALASLNSPNAKQALGLSTGLLAAFALLAGTARILMWAARRILRPSWPYGLRQGVSNLYRPQNQTLLFLLSLGLSTFLLLVLVLAEKLVLQRVNLASLKDSPGMYLVDVQPDQAEGVIDLLGQNGIQALENVPVITMRIKAVKGVPVAELLERKIGPKWVYRREFRSTARDTLNATESIADGQWNDSSRVLPGECGVSLEAKLAKDLQVTVGDVIDLDVQGVPLKARITSLRTVDWSKFNLNFFMIFEPTALDGAPAMHVVTARVPDGVSSGPFQAALVKAFPNVSVIDLAMMLETVAGIVGNVVTVVRLLAGFTLLAGLAILVGTFLNGRDQRIRESVLLRTLGASGGQIRQILVVEYATLGTLSALTGILLAQAAAYLLAIYVFKTAPIWALQSTLGIGLAAIVLSVAAGLALSRGICRHSPLGILRQAQ